ncbi:MAG: FAD-binding oxidoreductase, partial [Candidatus Thermoplasmatota archaeon]|nr:FAD-binding oxidoreductase [Candidatus Thermoplasmatota archaeon]
QQINSLAGLPSFTKPTLHEILATEPVKPFLKPMVVTLGRGTYFSQTMRGEIVGGLTMDHSRSQRQGLYSSGEFLVEMARELARLMPRVADVRILRCWSGYYDDSPDGLPLLGEDPRLKGFYQANGFGGHGFMLAPSSTARLAKILLGESTDLDPHWISPDRFTGQIPGRPVEGLSLG